MTIQWTFLSTLGPIGPVNSEKKIKNRQDPFWTSGSIVSFVYINKNHNSNEHSYQVWFHIGLVVLDKDSKRTTPFLTPLGLYFRGPSIEQSYQVCLQLAMWFQRRKIKANNTLFSQLWASCFFCVFQSTKKTFLEDHPTKFGSNLPSGFREED